MTSSQRSRLLLVDGHSLAYRAFYALPVENFSTTTGQPTNAVYGFTSMLINALRDEKPTHIAVAFDVSRKTFRSERFPQYKATRSASPEGFKGQVELIRDVLDALGITSMRVANFEADDILATLATTANTEDFDVLVLTGDRDALQLVNDRTTVLYPKRGVSDLVRFDPAAVEAKYGLTPAQYPDFAALRGDPSDNLPSVPGVGEKTATKWIREYGSLDDLLANADSVAGKVGESLRQHLDQVRTNRELTELVRDMPDQPSLDELAVTPIDRERVHEVFDALQFRALRDRLFESLGSEIAVEQPGAGVAGAPQVGGDTVVAAVDGDVTTWLRDHAQPPTRVGVAIAGTWGRGTGDATAIAIADPSGSSLWFDPSQLGVKDTDAVADWLADADRPKALHGAKGPMLALRARGWTLHGLAGDTELSAYLVLAGQRSFDLGDLVLRFLGIELSSDASVSGQLALETDGDDLRIAHLVQRAGATNKLCGVLDEEVAARGGGALLVGVELPLVSLLADMERTGICLDVNYLTHVEADYTKEVAKAQAQAHDLVGNPFNLGSPKQLQEILFVARKLPKTKKIKTGNTTDAEALGWLASVSDDPLPAVLLRWRDMTKLRQTVEGLLPFADAGNRIHTTFQQTVTATGRLSSTDPNLQNIPVRTEEGRRIRSGFIVGKGYEALLTADYSQIEMRIMAHLSQDAGLIEAFTSGEDLHITMAADVFGIDPGDVAPEHRRRIKAMSYGLAYGLSAFGLSQQLDISADEARRLVDDYFKRFGGVRDYLAEVVRRARSTGYTETLLGRRRYLPDLNSEQRQRREMAERMALNAPMQGSAADLVKVAMLQVEAALRGADMETRLLLQVHDELVLEVAVGETQAATDLVRREMTTVWDLLVPLEVSTGVGRSWQDAAH